MDLIYFLQIEYIQKMKYIKEFNESTGRTLKEVFDEAMFEINDNFDVVIFDDGLKNFQVGSVVISIIFENISSRGEFTFNSESFMGTDYPNIDIGIEYADTYADFLKALKRVMAKLESEGYKTKIISADIRNTKLTIYKPRP